MWVVPTGTYTDSGERIGRVANVLCGGVISIDDLVSYSIHADLPRVTGVLARSGRLAATIAADFDDDDLVAAAQWTTQRRAVRDAVIAHGGAAEGDSTRLLVALPYRDRWAQVTSEDLPLDTEMADDLGALLHLDLFTVDVAVTLGPAGGDPIDAASLRLEPPEPRPRPTPDQVDAAVAQVLTGYAEMVDRLTAAGFIPPLLDHQRFDAQLARVLATEPRATAAAAAGNIAAPMVLAARIEAAAAGLLVADLPGYVFTLDFDELAPPLP